MSPLRKPEPPRLALTLLTSAPFGDLEVIREVLMKFKLTPDLMPEKLDLVEPVRDKFGAAFFKKQAGNDAWSMMIFSRRRPFVSGSAGPAVFYECGRLSVSFEATPAVLPSAIELFHEWSKTDGLVFAQLAMPSLPIRLSMGDLKKGIPDLHWLTCFGKDYVRLLGRNKLRSAPVAEVRESKDRITLQLTRDPLDMLEQPLLVKSIRNRAVRHLGPENFFDGKNPKAARSTVPKGIEKLMPAWFGEDEEP